MRCNQRRRLVDVRPMLVEGNATAKEPRDDRKEHDQLRNLHDYDDGR
jgi:hypothetical protein